MLLNIIGTWVAATLTIGILPFPYKDSPLYKAAGTGEGHSLYSRAMSRRDGAGW
jgi:hypothetical protein